MNEIAVERSGYFDSALFPARFHSSGRRRAGEFVDARGQLIELKRGMREKKRERKRKEE